MPTLLYTVQNVIKQFKIGESSRFRNLLQGCLCRRTKMSGYRNHRMADRTVSHLLLDSAPHVTQKFRNEARFSSCQ